MASGDMRGERAQLVLVAGPPGAGKTTLARALGRALGWPVLDKDTIKSCLLNLGADEAIAGRASYELLIDQAHDMLAIGQSVILDAPGKYAGFLRGCASLTRDHNAAFRIILCHVDREERQRRLASRTARVSQWPALTAAERLGADDEWLTFFPAGTLVLDTSRSLDDLVAQATGFLADAGSSDAVFLVDE